MSGEHVPSSRKVRFYKTATGAELFRSELDKLGFEAKAELVAAIRRRSRGQHLPREDEQVRGRIRSIRATYDGCEYRALYAFVGAHDEVLLALHAINKKFQRLPKAVIDRAASRLADWERHGAQLRPERN